jgi:DNA-binding CsgD family transcriptional regulator
VGSARHGVLDRVRRIGAAGADARTLRLALLPELRAAVDFDAYAWVLTDPETEVGCAPLADVPSLAELPRLIRLRYLTAVNRWTELAEPAAASLAEMTHGELSRSLLWRELLCRYDVRDVCSVVFRDRYGCWAFLELWRTGSRAFEAAELAFLQEITGPVTAALRRCQAGTFRSGTPAGRRSGPLVLLLAPDLEVVRQTPGTGEALRLLVPRDDDAPPVPAGAFNVAAQLLAVEAGIDEHPPWARVHLAAGRWLTLRAARLQGPGPAGSADIAVSIEESDAGERLSLFARACGLSEREAELLGHLAAGADTAATARRMFLSPHTVQDHLKSVFAKTGTHSRRALLARALGG